jgi:hypothetical protein
LKKTVLDAKRIANNTVSFAKSYFVRERGICFACVAMRLQKHYLFFN